MARATTFKYTVTVSNPGSGNRYYIDGNLQQYVVLFPGCTYEFNQDDSSNATHPLRFSETSDGTHNSGSEYTTGVTTSGTPGSATAWTKIEVTTSTPIRLYYYCSSHSGMGGSVVMPESSVTGDTALQAGGESPATSNIDFIQISTTGNASKFGDLVVAAFDGVNCVGGETRALFGGGAQPSGAGAYANTIMSISFKTKGNAADFGDLQQGKREPAPIGNKIRGIFAGGNNPTARINEIDLVLLASVGNATDFGDLTQARSKGGGLSSPTRGCVGGGDTPSNSDVIDYITINTNGNATDFGDLTLARTWITGTSSSTRGLFGGGRTPTNQNIIDYITIGSTGNATDFGDLTTSRYSANGGSNNTRAVFMGGAPSNDVIDYVTIGSTGNATDFGDLTYTGTQGGGGNSNGHGGLQ